MPSVEREKKLKSYHRGWLLDEEDPRHWSASITPSSIKNTNLLILLTGLRSANPNECIWDLRFSGQATDSQKLADDEFAELVRKWKHDTRHSSSMKKSILHPAYLRIIGLGRPVLALLLRELRTNPDHWFTALAAVAGTDPAEHTQTFDEAVEAWLQWGRRNSLIE